MQVHKVLCIVVVFVSFKINFKLHFTDSYKVLKLFHFGTLKPKKLIYTYTYGRDKERLILELQTPWFV